MNIQNVFNGDGIYHHGILGQKWGIRRTPEQLGHATKKKQEKSTSNSSGEKSVSHKNIKYITDEELDRMIDRLGREKRYKDLVRGMNKNEKNQKKRVLDLVENILEASGKNIGTQLVTYGMGTAVNKIFKEEIVNPKKGQKDK